MMSVPKILSLILLVCSFIACKKNDSAETKTINGIVVKFPSRQPIPGVKVYLISKGLTFISNSDSNHWQIRYSDTVTKIPVLLIDSVISDASGKFSFSYVLKKDPIEGYDPTYRTAIYDPNLIRVYTGVVNTTPVDTILTDIPSFFRLNMHKVLLPNSNDTLFEQRNYSFLSTPYEVTWLSFRNAQVGQNNSSIFDTYSYNVSNKVRIEWRYYRNGLQQSGQQVVNLIPNDTTKVDIYY